MLNFDMASVYTYYLQTILDSQHPSGDIPSAVPIRNWRESQAGPSPRNASWTVPAVELGPDPTDISWTVAYPLIVRWMLKFYGDTRIVKTHYVSLKRYTDGLLARAAESSVLPIEFRWGDWCAIETREVATMATGAPMAAFNYILAIDAMGERAHVGGNASDVARYVAL
eukprot:SAG22_NODE_564_length_9060_cov_41.744225_4_plen_168_part_01